MTSSKKPGTFITFEGCEGSGKTTQINLLAATLEKRDIAFLQTREPGGTDLGNHIRHLLLDGSVTQDPISARSELLLYLASRAQHVSEKILPALKAGKIVLCDRFSDATIAYQSEGRGLPEKEIIDMCRFAAEGLLPTVTFLMDLRPEVGLARVKARGEMNRLDKEHLRFHQAVYAGYHRLALNEPERFTILDAGQDIPVIAKKIQERIDVLLS